jgi:hypothetical protein
MKLAAERIRAARAHLQGLGIVDDEGELISNEIPPDIDPASEATETG